jgi:hypothetical protein
VSFSSTPAAIPGIASLAASAQWTDSEMLAEWRRRRTQANLARLQAVDMHCILRAGVE